jgi:hypothetical protein
MSENRTVQIKLDSGHTATVEVGEQKNEWQNRNTKTRVAVGASEEVDKELLGDHPPYGSEHGDGSDEDKAWKAYNRAELKMMKEVATKTFALWDVEFKGNYSRTAGCSCGCSPAFILKDDKGRYMWLTVKEVKKV